MPLPHTVAAAPDGLPPRPGGRSKREYGVTVIGLDVFEPTRYCGRSMLVSLRRIGIWTVSPAGLETVIVPVASGSIPSMCSATTPPSPEVTTGITCTDAGAPGESYAHATVRTLDREVPTLLRANASYVRCSPLGAAIGGHVPSAAHWATSCPFERMTKPVRPG